MKRLSGFSPDPRMMVFAFCVGEHTFGEYIPADIPDMTLLEFVDDDDESDGIPIFSAITLAQNFAYESVVEPGYSLLMFKMIDLMALADSIFRDLVLNPDTPNEMRIRSMNRLVREIGTGPSNN